MNPLVLFDPAVARPLLAGWISGAMVGLVHAALVVIAVARSPRWPDLLSNLRVSLPAFAIVAINAMLIGWTLVGLVLGAIWIVVPMPRFSIAIVLVAGGALGLYAFVRGTGRRGETMLVVACGAVAAVVFAGVLPALAGWR